jgi:hypothetical protein
MFAQRIEVNFTSVSVLGPRDLESFDSWHSPSNAHTYRLLVFKELAFRRSLISFPFSAKKAILTCFSKPCQTLNFLIFALSVSRTDRGAVLSEDRDYSILFAVVNDRPR